MPMTFTENTSIDYDVHGEGPPLILIGGLGFGRWRWFKQVPAFSIPGAGLRVLDHAGHLVFIERFADVNREVVSFLKSRENRKPRRPRAPAAAPKTERGLRGLYRAVYRRIRGALSPFS